MTSAGSLLALGDGHRVATWTTGQRTELPPVVLLHGGPGLWDYLEPMAAMLDDLTVVHRYDQRGCGRSDPGGPHTISQYVADLDDLRRRWGYDEWIVIGHSFGATLGLAYGATHPERTAAVGYVSGVGIGDWRTSFNAERNRRAEPFASRRDALDALAERTWAEEVEYRTLHWATDYAAVDVGLQLALPMATTNLAISREANAGNRFGDEDCARWAAGIRSPMTFIHGSHDPRPAANARALRALVPGSSFHQVEGAGHLPWVEQPGAVAGVLRTLVGPDPATPCR